MISKDYEEFFSNEALKNIFIYFQNNNGNLKSDEIEETINKLCRQCGLDFQKCSEMDYKDLLKKCDGFKKFYNGEN